MYESGASTGASAMNKWGVFEERNEHGRLLALHVIPVAHLDIDDDFAEVSCMHTLSNTCPCQPLYSGMNDQARCPILSHHDPEQLGMSELEWVTLVSAAVRGSLPN